MNDNPIPDIEIMINRMIDGQLAPDEQAAVERQLIRDPSAHAMLRDCEALNDRCRDAIGAALAGPVADHRQTTRSWGAAIFATTAAAAIIVLGIVFWSSFVERPDSPGEIAGKIDNRTPTTVRGVELAVDRFDPAPPRRVMTRPVRQVDRIPVALYDAESGQMRIILVDREQEQQEPQWLDL
jgi:hypothetical protein